MFTGIAEETGKITALGSSLKISAKTVLEDVHIGDSIAVNGICLTVTASTGDSFTVDVMPETFKRTALGTLSVGSRVNLERAMAANGRFGGHIVSGHIDGTGRILSRRSDGNAVWLSFGADKSILKYIVLKGSVAINGISLTVAEVSEDSFSVSLIPHTAQNTNLLDYGTGDIVNIETDVIAKYTERLLAFNKSDKPLDEDFFKRCGF